MKTLTILISLSTLLLWSCQESTSGSEKPNTTEPGWVTVSSSDDDGHGPDPGTEEAAYAMAHKFILGHKIYTETGRNLTVTRCTKSTTNPEIIEAEYMYRILGKNGAFYKGTVEIKGDKARFVDNSGETLEIKNILEDIVKKALENDNGQAELTDSSVMGDVLTTEHQYLEVYNLIQQVFKLNLTQMDALWVELSPDASFLDWQNVLKNS